MGKKGAKQTTEVGILASDVMEKLISIDGISSKRMFGGEGIFFNGKMFGMITAKALCFFKVDDSNLEDYTNIGSEKHSRMPYYHIPDEVLSNKDQLIEFALKSIEVSESKKK